MSFLGGLASGFQPQAGSRFVILNNDGADAVTGQFAGLPEGANMNIGGAPFSISYQGGDGNDVELRYLGGGGPPRILTISYNKLQDKVHLEALATPEELCHWQVSGNMTSWSNFASGVPDSAGFLKLDQVIGLHANRLYFRLLKP